MRTNVPRAAGLSGTVTLPSPSLWFIGGEDISLKLPLLLAMRTRGFSVAAAGTEPPAPFLSESVPYWQYQGGGRPLVTGRARDTLRRLLVEKRPDIVHAFDTLPGALAPIAARRAGVPGRLCTVTGLGSIYSSRRPLALSLRPLYRSLRKRGCSACDVVVFQNDEDRRWFLREGIVPAGRDRLIPGSGIDVDAFEKARPDEAVVAALRRDLGIDRRIVVSMIARLVPAKGVGEFLETASRIRARRNDVAFLMVGAAPRRGERSTLRRAVRCGVRWPGHRTDIPAILAASDILVLPSRYREGIPRVLLEAGAMGLPLIATDMPGCRDVVKHGRNGLLVPPGDAEALEAAVIDLLEADEERRRMGACGRDHIRDRFGLTAVAESYRAIYEETMVGARRAGIA